MEARVPETVRAPLEALSAQGLRAAQRDGVRRGGPSPRLVQDHQAAGHPRSVLLLGCAAGGMQQPQAHGHRLQEHVHTRASGQGPQGPHHAALGPLPGNTAHLLQAPPPAGVPLRGHASIGAHAPALHPTCGGAVLQTGGHGEKRLQCAHPAPLLRHSPARCRRGHPHHQGTARPQHARQHGDLPAPADKKTAGPCVAP